MDARVLESPRSHDRHIQRRGLSLESPGASNDRCTTPGWETFEMKTLFAAMLAAAIPLAGHAADAPKPRNRAEATDVIRELRRIVTPQGIERTQTVRIGGIDQFITIRGTDRRNPV